MDGSSVTSTSWSEVLTAHPGTEADLLLILGEAVREGGKTEMVLGDSSQRGTDFLTSLWEQNWDCETRCVLSSPWALVSLQRTSCGESPDQEGALGARAPLSF